jgi:hypothetical protein
VPENVYDSQFGADKLEVDVAQVEGTEDAAGAIQDADPRLLLSTTTTVASGTGPTLTLASTPGMGDVGGALVVITDVSSGQNHRFRLVGYNALTNELTIDDNPFNVAVGDEVRLYATPKQLPNAAPGAPGGLFIAGTNAQTMVTSGFGAGTITGTTYDNSTAYPLASADSGSTAVARTGADADTLETLSDQIDGLSSGASPVTVGGFNATGLADLFDTDSGTAYNSAVAGSVVKEIADNAAISPLTADGIADAVLREVLSDHTSVSGSLADVVDDIFNFLDGAPTFGDAMDGQGYSTALASKLDTNVDAKISEVPAKMPSLLVSSTIDDTTVTVTQTSFALTDGPPDDDALNGALVIITDAVTSEQKAVGIVKDYEQSSKTVTLFADPGVFTFADGDKVDVIASGAHQPLW